MSLSVTSKVIYNGGEVFKVIVCGCMIRFLYINMYKFKYVGVMSLIEGEWKFMLFGFKINIIRRNV